MSPSRTRRALTLGLVGLTVAALTTVLGAAPAVADTAPVDLATPETVSADALPTVQVDGIVWAQVVAGNRVYVTGDFDNARPAGAAPGTSQTPRSNVLAYDLTTGALVSNWNASLNAQGLAIAASPDGTRIYVGGDFTQVNGVNRYRIVALDATTGAIIPSFAGSANARVRSLAVAGNTVFAGGIFSTMNNQPRTRLAAIDATTGLLPWAPTADAEVMTMTSPPGSGRLVIGGKFQNVNASPWYGMASLDTATGATQPWNVVSVVRNAGNNAGIYSLSSDAAGGVYGTGYTFGSGGNFEGTFAAAATDGALRWVNGCRGDTYSSFPVGDVLYAVGHPHDCGPINEIPQTNPWTWQRATAFTTAAGLGRTNTSGSFNGRPASGLLHWLPTLEAGDVSGSTQAAWSVSGNTDYVVLGGEFPTVNGTAQEGLVRFRLRTGAPNTQGPVGSSDLAPTFAAAAGGGVRVSWTTVWDRDNHRLTYELLRGSSLGSATVVARTTAESRWWARGPMALLDTTAAPGSTQTYRVRVIDPFGNTMVGPTASTVVPAAAAPASTYRDGIAADVAVNHWRLGEASGTVGSSVRSGDDLTLVSTAVRNQTGAVPGDTATRFAGGNSGVPATTTQVRRGPQVFSVEAWFSTTSTQGGGIIGFGNSATGASSVTDRVLYMTNNGRLRFGTTAAARVTVGNNTAYNDGVWHHAVGTVGPDGIRLYVDGQLVGQNADGRVARDVNGYWRVGGDSLSGWPDAPSSRNLAGTIDEAATYLTPLTQAQVDAHRALAAGQVPNAAPTASFTVTPNNLVVAVDAAASADTDGTITSYAWDFGDGGTATGVTAQRTYAAAGTYTVSLMVTDDDGATTTTTQPVTVTAAPPVNTPFAQDAFGRTTTGGLGSADTGGPWTVTNPASSYSVSGGAGRILMPTAGAIRTATLGQVASTDTRLNTTVALDKEATGGGVYASVHGRYVPGVGDYRTRLRFLAGGAVTAQLMRASGGVETSLASITVPGLTYTAGTVLNVRLEVVGTGTTTLRTKVWPAGSAEPGTWLLTSNDSTSALQVPGSVGVTAYASGSTTNAPVTLSLDDLVARPTPAP